MRGGSRVGDAGAAGSVVYTEMYVDVCIVTQSFLQNHKNNLLYTTAAGDVR